MKKFFIIAITILLISVVILLLYFKVTAKSYNGIYITFLNKTNSEISGLRLTYENITSDIQVSAIPPDGEFSIDITPKEAFSENTMKMYYYDKNNKKHEEIIVSYFEKGYKGRVKVEIKNINTDGIINFKSSDLKLYLSN